MDDTAEGPSERRKHVRFALSGELPGNLTNASGQDFAVLPVDVSMVGLGVLLDPGPSLGERLSLTIRQGDHEQELVFVVKWTAAESFICELPGLDQLRHCGLELEAPTDFNLVHFLSSFAGVSIEE